MSLNGLLQGRWMQAVLHRWIPICAALLAGLASFLPLHHPAVGMVLLSQYGLVLLWQPVYRPTGRVGGRGVVAVLLVGFLLAMLGAAALPFWVALLAALAAGRATAGYGNWATRFHVGLLLWLLGLLWLRSLPALAGVQLPQQRSLAALLLALLFALALLPADAVREGRQRQDFLFALLAMVLGLLIGMSALLLDALHITPYLAALAGALIIAGLVLGLTAWLWNPRGGFAGLGAVLSAQLLRLGTPFEDWSGRLAELSVREDDPRALLAAACHALLDLPPVIGGDWEAAQGAGSFGAHTQHSASFRAQGLTLTLYAQAPIPSALYVQFQLVTELLQQFLRAKEREQRLADYMYVEAVHETGARLTHDIKNLLQALKTLIGAADADADPARLLALYTRQLPTVVKRLEDTLSRLRTPAEAEAKPQAADEWWSSAQGRWRVADVSFLADAVDASNIDASLFDAVLDNLVQNALDKRLAVPAAAAFPIRAELRKIAGAYVLAVEDGGAPVPASIVTDLFRRPVTSRSGYGLGLYQLARLAGSRGYALALAGNEAGAVRFELTPG